MLSSFLATVLYDSTGFFALRLWQLCYMNCAVSNYIISFIQHSCHSRNAKNQCCHTAQYGAPFVSKMILLQQFIYAML